MGRLDAGRERAAATARLEKVQRFELRGKGEP